MPILKLNIALIPTQKSGGEMIALSKLCAQADEALFVLDGQNYNPHLTLFKLEMGDHRLNALAREVEMLARYNPVKTLLFTEANAGERGYVGLRTEHAGKLLQLHYNLVQATHALGRTAQHWSTERVAEMTHEQQSNLRMYGYPYVLGCYNPHVTVTRLKDWTCARKIADFLSVEHATPTVLGVAGIGIFLSGDHGTCRELVRAFSFEQQPAIATR